MDNWNAGPVYVVYAATYDNIEPVKSFLDRESAISFADSLHRGNVGTVYVQEERTIYYA